MRLEKWQYASKHYYKVAKIKELRNQYRKLCTILKHYEFDDGYRKSTIRLVNNVVDELKVYNIMLPYYEEGQIDI